LQWYVKLTDRLKPVCDKLAGLWISVDRLVAALIASFMMSYIYQMLVYGNFGDRDAYFNKVNFAAFFLIAALMFAALVALTILLKTRYIIPWVLMVLTVAVSVIFALNFGGAGSYSLDTNAIFFALGIGVVDLAVVLWVTRSDKLGIACISLSRRVALIAAGVLFIVTTVIFGYLTSLKYRNYINFTFDFGIFAQMYEGMARTGAPVTTVERSHMLSHFGVHFSPIFYLFLPGYLIFRSPIYLFYIQAAAVAAGIFAVYLIAGKLGLSGKMTLALELLYAFYPCLLGGTFYDFHENKFLTSIILFLFYFIISKRTVWTFVFSLLLLSVKEDAAIYLMVIALFVMINRKEIVKGVCMLLMATVYFIIASQIVAAVGDGVMISRLDDYFVNGEQSFGAVFKSLFFNIGHMLKNSFTADKIPFLIWLLAPVAFTPLLTKKGSALILLLPVLPINIMQSWPYQYDISYQYTYGIGALVIMSAILVIAQLKGRKRHVVTLMALCLSMVSFLLLVSPKMNYVLYWNSARGDTCAQADELIETVPTDASVTTDHSLMPHLYKVERLYSIPEQHSADRNVFETPLQTDYFVVNTGDPTNRATMLDMMGDSYDLVGQAAFVEVYKHK